MQDIPQETLSETTKAEQSAKVDLWEFDLTAIGGERFFFCNEPNEKGEPLTWQGRQYEPYPIQVSDRRLFGLHHFTCRGYQRLSEGSWAVHHVCFRLAAGDGFPVGEQLHKLTGFPVSFV